MSLEVRVCVNASVSLPNAGPYRRLTSMSSHWHRHDFVASWDWGERFFTKDNRVFCRGYSIADLFKHQKTRNATRDTASVPGIADGQTMDNTQM
ncbi:hypothetical protein BgiMline_018642 [Biomphalaria glabrata]|nr:hypothetical protein BgiMline_006254 [Biomphalaria glabrata]